MDIPNFNTKSELFNFLVTNKDVLIAQKKAKLKFADPIIYQPQIISIKPDANKSDDNNMPVVSNDVMVKVVINTTNILDSCLDVHLPGIWAKSLKENKAIMHLQEHEMEFAKIIADGKELMAYTKTYSFSELGIQLPGNTEALIFESLIKADRNPFMADQYRKGYVKNHSVGMHYVKIVLCINDENNGAEFEAWEKYYPEIANKEMADEYGYFWAIKEAKVIEGSAVPRGANWATPTISVTEQKNNQPEVSTGQKIEPPTGTHKAIDYQYLINNLKF